jgi:membrane protein DedA with SNARE-associated domain
MSPAGVVAAGTLGSWIGATIMYWAARIAGRPLVLSFAAWWTAWLKRHPLIDRLPFVHFSPETVERAERWSARFGKMGVFVSRLVPVVRHLIGIPSGVVRVNFGQYSASTVAGALVWCIVLAAVGIAAGNNPALMQGDLRAVGLAVAGSALVLGTVYYFFVYRVMKVERPAA